MFKKDKGLEEEAERGSVVDEDEDLGDPNIDDPIRPDEDDEPEEEEEEVEEAPPAPAVTGFVTPRKR